MCEKMAVLRFTGELFEHLQTEEVFVCYTLGCVWLEQATADSVHDLPNAERYEFDFGSPEIAYASAKAIIEILEESIPDIKTKSMQVQKKRNY